MTEENDDNKNYKIKTTFSEIIQQRNSSLRDTCLSEQSEEETDMISITCDNRY